MVDSSKLPSAVSVAVIAAVEIDEVPVVNAKVVGDVVALIGPKMENPVPPPPKTDHCRRFH